MFEEEKEGRRQEEKEEDSKGSRKMSVTDFSVSLFRHQDGG